MRSRERKPNKQELDPTDLAQMLGLTKLDVTEEQLKEAAERQRKLIEKPKEPTKLEQGL